MINHDELMTFRKIAQETREEIEDKLNSAMEEVNKSLSLNVQVKVDCQWGRNYSECH